MSMQFTSGIKHPEFYLWDAWSYESNNVFHLFCLAIPRRDFWDAPIDPSDRNNHAFHIHHFESTDSGATWRDVGVHRRPGMTKPYDEANVWSGSVTPLPDGIVEAYTGVRSASSEQPFIQNLVLSLLNADGSGASGHCVLCPERDHDYIVSSGYFIDDKENLGSNKGECGGPILAWRDPFVFAYDQKTYVAFAAKSSEREPALGIAQLVNGLQEAVLLPPISLPDSDEFTQFEIPKLFYLQKLKQFILVAATTDRQSEMQDDCEISNCIRLYIGESPFGPWIRAGKQSSILCGVDHLFGATILGLDERNNRLIFMAPYTSKATDDLQLSFAPRFFVTLDQLSQQDQLFASGE